MNDGLIPQRYARALYKFALERNNATAVYEEMKQVADSFESAPALQRVMTNPFVDRERKEKLLVSAAGDKVEDDYRRFVKLVLDHNREAYAYCMALDYRRIYRDVKHIAQVVITTAAELPGGRNGENQGCGLGCLQRLYVGIFSSENQPGFDRRVYRGRKFYEDGCLDQQ